VITCPECGSQNPRGFRFCGSCGSALPEAPSARELRKIVTVLFCDVAGSTALGERTDPEPLRRLMAQYYDEMRKIVERHGGTVEKFIGDAVVAVFGVPQAHEDDALRAVRAAAEMQASVVPLDLQIRIGVNTGEVVTGEGETLVTGDAVNVAARLQQTAAPSETLIGAKTLRLVRDAVVVETLPPVKLKGKAQPVAARRLVSVDPAAPAVARRFDAPMVGRDRELQRVRSDFEHAVSERACHMFTLLGPAGVGKSRLVRAFVDGIGDDARVLRGRCLHYGEGITYWPLVEVLMQLGREPESVIGNSPAETQLAFRKLLEGEAAQRPIIVYFDDLQWAEATFLDLLEYVADWSRDAPIFLLCVARPELLDLRPAWGGGKLNAASILLEPLGDGESNQLVENLLGASAIDEELRKRIVGAAEGNPLFVEEMIAMVREDGSGGDVVVPPTIHALLQARIDRLRAEERAVMERGAVEGKIFHRGSVHELAPEPLRPDVDGHLLTLVRKELIRPDRPTLPGEEAFRFRHLLIRDAAYESLPKETRAELHERFANWLDRHGELVEQDEIVGYHLEQAALYRSELGAPNAQLAERAAERLAAAARAAFGRGDWNAGRSLSRRTLELVPKRHQLRLGLMPAYVLGLLDTGEFEPARAAVEELRSSQDERAETFGRLLEFEVSWIAGHGRPVEEFEQAVEYARAVFERLGDDEGLAYAFRALGYANWVRLRTAASARAFERATAHARRANAKALEGEFLVRSASAHMQGPTPVPDAIAYCERHLEEASSLVRSDMMRVLGPLYAMRGDFATARELVRAGREGIREAGLLATAAAGAMVASFVEMYAGEPEEADRLLREGIAELERLGDHAYQSTATMYLAARLEEQGSVEEAERWLQRARELTNPSDLIDSIGVDAVEARLLARRGRLHEAEQLARKACEAAATTDLVGAHRLAVLALVRVLEEKDRLDEARQQLHRLLELFEAKEDVVMAARLRDQINALV
jgi:class 3 adenylate cyclase/predicted ATPase